MAPTNLPSSTNGSPHPTVPPEDAGLRPHAALNRSWQVARTAGSTPPASPRKGAGYDDVVDELQALATIRAATDDSLQRHRQEKAPLLRSRSRTQVDASSQRDVISHTSDPELASGPRPKGLHALVARAVSPLTGGKKDGGASPERIRRPSSPKPMDGVDFIARAASDESPPSELKSSTCYRSSQQGQRGSAGRITTNASSICA